MVAQWVSLSANVNELIDEFSGMKMSATPAYFEKLTRIAAIFL